MLYSEYQLICTQINVGCRLIILLNRTSVIVRLFGCVVVEKHEESQENSRASFTFNDK